MAQYPCHPASTHLTRDQATRVLSAAGFAADQMRTMVAIGIAESNLGVDAIGDCALPPPRVGYRSFGIWQILQSPTDQDNHAQIDDLLSPQGNANAAHNIYNRQGYRAWSTFNNGAYAHYLDSSSQTSGNGGIVGSGVVRNIAGAIGAPLKAIGSAEEAIVHTAQWFGNRHNWIRVIEVIAGLIAVVVGLIIVNRDAVGSGLKAAAGAAAKGALA